jgi:hypothetical protein
MTDLSKTSITWRDLTVGAGTPYRMLTLEGWEELPGARYEQQPRTNAHGAHPSPVYSDERIVNATGWCWTSDQRDQLLADFRARFTFEDDTEPLTITAAGKTLTAGGQVIAAQPSLLRGQWGVGRFGWLLKWRCPDPLRYGAPVTVSTGLPSAGGGLAYPLAYPLDYGATGATGRLTLANSGTAPAPIVFAVTGSLDQGFEISAAGQRLTYPVPVPAGQVIELDTAAGTVLVEGTASRRGNLSNADWMTVPKGGELTVQFTSLGAFDPAALLAATVSGTNW